MTATVRQLRDRWKKDPWPERDAAICAWHPIAAETPDYAALAALLDGLPFREEVPSGWDLRGSSLAQMRLVSFDGLDASHCRALNLQQSKFVDSRFVGTGPWYHVGGQFDRCDFSSAQLQRASFLIGPHVRCRFDDANLIGAHAIRIDFRGSTFRGAKLRRAELGGCDLRGCDFSDADLTDASLVGSTVDETTIFRGAKLVQVLTDREHGPPELQSRLDLTIAQMDERTVFEKFSVLPPASFWHEWLSAIMHHLPHEAKGKRWAPVIRELVEGKRQSLKGKPPADIETWTLEIIAAVDPADRAEVEAFLEYATARGM